MSDQYLKRAIQLSLKTAKEDKNFLKDLEEAEKYSKELEEIRKLSIKTAEEEQSRKKKQFVNQFQKTSKFMKRFENAQVFEQNLETESDAVKQIINQFPGSTHYRISGDNNDCMYRAALLGLFGCDAPVQHFKRSFIKWFKKPINDAMISTVQKNIEFIKDGDKKITELNETQSLDTFKETLEKHVMDNRMASEAEAAIMQNYVEEVGDGVYLGSARTLHNQISNNGLNWNALIVNVIFHYEVIVNGTQRGGSAKNTEYRKLQKIAKIHGVKDLKRDAATLKRAISQKKAKLKKKGGAGGDEQLYDQTCTGDECDNCLQEALGHYIFFLEQEEKK